MKINNNSNFVIDDDDPLLIWEDYLDKAKSTVRDAPFQDRSELTILWAGVIKALAHQLAGIACDRCGGEGEKVYASTATWRGGIGGQVLTPDVCDKCWGSGRVDKQGPDLRKLKI